MLQHPPFPLFALGKLGHLLHPALGVEVLHVLLHDLEKLGRFLQALGYRVGDDVRIEQEERVGVGRVSLGEREVQAEEAIGADDRRNSEMDQVVRAQFLASHSTRFLCEGPSGSDSHRRERAKG
jgi:hypothetical protein